MIVVKSLLTLLFVVIVESNDQEPMESRFLNTDGPFHDLIVETCIHVHPTVLENLKHSLNTNDLDYLNLYLELRLSEDVANVNKIYSSLTKNKLFALRVDLIQLVIHNQTNSAFDSADTLPYSYTNSNTFLDKARKFVSRNYIRRQPEQCDHVFFMHGYPEDRVLGLAHSASVCSRDFSTSLNVFHASSDVVMAHELGHNLGAEHDRSDSNKYSLMYPMALQIPSVRLLSNQSLNEIGNALIDSDQLKEKYECLTRRSVVKQDYSYYHEFLRLKPLGGQLSDSDQCSFLSTSDKKLYFACYVNNRSCLIECWNGVECEYKNKLDGTSCGSDRFCLFGECVNRTSYNRLKFALSSAEKYEYENQIERAVNLIRHHCPQGSSQEAKITNKRFRNWNELAYGDSMRLLKNGSCQKYAKSVVSQGCMNEICCEECIKYEIKKTVSRLSDPCELNPCFNQGVCVRQDKNEFVCKCRKGFYGPLCLDLDPCEMNACLENEICYRVGHIGGFYCLCPPHHPSYPYCRGRVTYLQDKPVYVQLSFMSTRMILNSVALLIFNLILVGLVYFTALSNTFQ